MRIPDPIANTTTEAYLAYKAGVLSEGDLKPKLYDPYIHLDAWLAYWAGLTNTYPNKGIGKNLINVEQRTFDANGVTVTVGADNTITLDGTPSAQYNKSDQITISNTPFLPVGSTYTYSLKYISGSANGGSINLRVGANTTEYNIQFSQNMIMGNADEARTVTMGESGVVGVSGYVTKIQLVFGTNNSFSNYKIQLQLEEGSQATPFEPYKIIPEMLTDEEALIAYLSGVTNTYPEEFRDPADVRVAAYLKYLVSARWGRPEYPVTNEELYLSMMDAPYIPAGEPSSDIEIDDTAEAPFRDVKMYGDTSQNGTPTPDAPVAVQTVTGENVVKITGKNLFDIDEYTNAILRGGGSAVSLAKIDGSTLRTTNLISQGNNFVMIPLPDTRALLGKQATVSFAAKVSGVNSAKAVFFWMSDTNYTTQLGDAVFAGSDGNYTLTTSIPSAIPSGSTRLGLVFYASGGGSNPPAAGSYVDWSNIQIELGSTATAYEPYQEQSYEVNLGKNLFDKNNVNDVNGTIGSSNIFFGGANYFVYIPCQPNTTYTVQKRNDGDTNRFAVATTAVIPTDPTTTYDFTQKNDASSITIITSSTARYILVMYYRTSETTLTKQQLLDSIQIEAGSTPTQYSAYFTPIELCKIGDYQDYIYKSGGKWYVHKEVGKAVLDGSESGWTRGALNGNTTYRFFVTISGIKTTQSADSLGLVLSDKLVEITNGSQYSGTEGIRVRSNGAEQLAISTYATQTMTVDNFQTWLAANNIIAYYALATPTDTEITNEALIEQLDALKNGGSYEGKTYITVSATDPNLPGLLEVEAYKYD